MNIVLLEPFYTGSHKSWADSFKQKSSHNIEILSLENLSWKKAMTSGAEILLEKYKKNDVKADLILANDLVNLPNFLQGLNLSIPSVIYFHENQLTYPWSKNEKNLVENKKIFGLINYNSALVADKCFFNSKYHKESFINSLNDFLDQFEIKNKKESIENIKAKSEVLYLGLDLKRFDQYVSLTAIKNKKPIILWNHRWEYDKNPKEFFTVLKEIKSKNIEFQLIVLGEHFHQGMPIFEDAKEHFKSEIIHFGYVESFSDYAKYLHMADILPVTSNQDFFGASIVEAIYCNTTPLLPNRLSYSELIPNSLYSDFIYSSDLELLSKLKNLINNNSADPQLKKHVEGFDWNNLIAIYDASFLELF